MDKRPKNNTTYRQNGKNYTQPNPYYTTVSDSRGENTHQPAKTHHPVYNQDRNKKMSLHSNRAKSLTNLSKTGNSLYRTSIQHRIEKACPTSSTADLKKQIILLNNEIQKLQKQLLKKDQLLLSMRNKVLPNKEQKIQLLQLYRVVNYYEGKVKQMEKQLNQFRNLIVKTSEERTMGESLHALIENFRRDREELAGQFQQVEFMRTNTEDKYRRLKGKYQDTQRELSQYKRKQISPLYQYYLHKQPSSGKFHRIFNQLLGKNASGNLEMKEKQLVNQSLQEKLCLVEKQNQLIHGQMNKLEEELSRVKGENSVLINEIEEKDVHITELFTNYMCAKKNLKLIQLERNKNQIGSASSARNFPVVASMGQL